MEFVHGSYLHVNIYNPIYDYLDRLATQGVLPYYQNNTLPLKREYIANILINLNNQRDKLSRVDQKLLDEYLVDYRYELTDMQYFKLVNGETTYHPFSSWSNMTRGARDVFLYTEKQENHHIVVYEKDRNLIWMDIGGMARYEINNSHNRLPYSYHYNLSVLLGDHFIVYSDADLYSILHDAGFYGEYPQEYKGGSSANHEGFFGFDYEQVFEYANAYVQYSSNIGHISLASEPLLWGNARYPIILSDNVPPFPMISWDKRLGNSSFSFFHGTILPAEPKGQDDAGLISFASKYLVGHRWEISITDKLNGAFTEMLVYGGRDPELVYFIPTIFLLPVQQSNTTSQAADNILWFIEAEYFPVSGLKLYSTFIIDELRVSEIFNDWDGNRWGLQGGTHIAGELFTYPTDLRIEFTAIHPWTYTHRVPLYGTYTHHGRSLGFEHGPNSQLLLMENRWWVNTRNRFSISYEQLKWGEEPEEDKNDEYHFGNNPNDNYILANPDYEYQTGWIIGDIQITHTIKLLWEYQLSNIIGLKMGFLHKKGTDKSENMMSIQVNMDY